MASKPTKRQSTTPPVAFLLTVKIIEEQWLSTHGTNLASIIFEALQNSNEQEALTILAQAKVPEGLERRIISMCRDALNVLQDPENFAITHLALTSDNNHQPLTMIGEFLTAQAWRNLRKQYLEQVRPQIHIQGITPPVNLGDASAFRDDLDDYLRLIRAEAERQAREEKDSLDLWLQEQTKGSWYEYTSSSKGLEQSALSMALDRQIVRPRTERKFKHLTDTKLASEYRMAPDAASKAQSAVAKAIGYKMLPQPGRGRKRTEKSVNPLTP